MSLQVPCSCVISVIALTEYSSSLPPLDLLLYGLSLSPFSCSYSHAMSPTIYGDVLARAFRAALKVATDQEAGVCVSRTGSLSTVMAVLFIRVCGLALEAGATPLTYLLQVLQRQLHQRRRTHKSGQGRSALWFSRLLGLQQPSSRGSSRFLL